eukprot:8651407-Pyramimonas_sp.AAC.1
MESDISEKSREGAVPKKRCIVKPAHWGDQLDQGFTQKSQPRARFYEDRPTRALKPIALAKRVSGIRNPKSPTHGGDHL